MFRVRFFFMIFSLKISEMVEKIVNILENYIGNAAGILYPNPKP